MRKMMMESYKRFLKKGIWTIDNIDYLLSTNKITDEEYEYITNDISTARTINNVDHGLDYMYEIWDKTSPVNGVPADEIIKSSGLRSDVDIILVKLGNNVIEVSDVETLRTNHNISLDATTEDIGREHVSVMTEIRDTPHVDIDEVNTASRMMHDYKTEETMSQMLGLLTDIKGLLTRE